MTPLAQHLLNDWCSPIKDRKVGDPHKVLTRLTGARCFEFTGIIDFIEDLARSDIDWKTVFESDRVFLPAPVTFLECLPSGKGLETRLGFLLIEDGEERITIYGCSLKSCEKFGEIVTSKGHRDSVKVFPPNGKWEEKAQSIILAVLFLINSPNILGNITHFPHAGLQRKIAAAKGMVGKFPLQAWTEITLFIDPTGKHAERENRTVEAHLSGNRCLHFVRAFLRWRLGRIERVAAHWRGDPSLGIKRSRYICKPKDAHP